MLEVDPHFHSDEGLALSRRSHQQCVANLLGFKAPAMYVFKHHNLHRLQSWAVSGRQGSRGDNGASGEAYIYMYICLFLSVHVHVLCECVQEIIVCGEWDAGTDGLISCGACFARISNGTLT